jgi:tetratricopeptide (TPR) repeat protein
VKKLPLPLVVFLLIFLAWHSARSGYASLLTNKVDSLDDLPAVTKAVGLSPADPRAQVLLGALLEASNINSANRANNANSDRVAAISHYQTAVALRPDDYLLRLQLARGQELAGDTAGAINSATVAVTLAPFYAQPHWQLGNMLVRAGRADGGFSELRLAGASDPKLFPAIVDLAWQLSGGKVDYVLAATEPMTPDAYKALANCFKRQGETAAAIKMIEAGGSATAPERRAYVAELIAAGKFVDAHILWGRQPLDPDEPPHLFDRGFEDEIDLDEPGFSWRASTADKSVALSLDTAAPKEGRASLRVEFSGAANAGAEVLSQLLLVENNTPYELKFAVRTESLVSGGLPNLSVFDATNNKLLGQTGAFPQTTNGWQETTVNFTTGASTTAVRVSLGRQPCSAPQCPIFGKLWLDDFRLARVVPRD